MRVCDCQFCEAVEKIQRGNAETAKIIRDLEDVLDNAEAVLDLSVLSRPRGRAAQRSPYDIGGTR